MLRKIFDPKKYRVTGLWERGTNLEIEEIFSEADLMLDIRRTQNQTLREVIKEIPNGKSSLGRRR